jgi:hypothetical protein
MLNHRSHVLRSPPNRPLDRGELAGLPSLAPLSHEFDLPTAGADADERETLGHGAMRWARPLRILIEIAVGVFLLTALISLLTNVARLTRSAGLRCPFGTSQGVMATTGCQIVVYGDVEDR